MPSSLYQCGRRLAKYGNGIMPWMLVLSLSSGCSYKAWTVFPTLGIRPNHPTITYSSEVQTRCGTYSSPPTPACLDFFNTVEWGQGLSEAYRSRATMNEWSLTAAAVLGLVFIGTLSGLAAFGQGGSDAAKIIPLAGGFATGVTAWFDNKTRAKEYTLAADKIDGALAKAMAAVAVDGTDKTIRYETSKLYTAIYDAERELEKKRKIEALTEERLRAAEEGLKGTEQKLNNVIKELQKKNIIGPSSTQDP